MKKLEKFQSKFYKMIRTNDFMINEEIISEHYENKFVELADAEISLSPDTVIQFHIDNYGVWMEPLCGLSEGVGVGSYLIGFLVNGKVLVDRQLVNDAALGIANYSVERLGRIENLVDTGNDITFEDESFLLNISNLYSLTSDWTTEMVTKLSNNE